MVTATLKNPAVAQGEVDTSLLEGLVGYRLRRAQSVLAADFMAAMSNIGIRPVQFAILAVVQSNPGLIQIALGNVLGIQRANLVPLLNELEGRKLLRRKAAPHDRRALALHLTPTGEALLGNAIVRVRAHEDRVLSGLTADERAKLIELLGKMRAE